MPRRPSPNRARCGADASSARRWFNNSLNGFPLIYRPSWSGFIRSGGKFLARIAEKRKRDIAPLVRQAGAAQHRIQVKALVPRAVAAGKEFQPGGRVFGEGRVILEFLAEG